jgi:hypothetical protein
MREAAPNTDRVKAVAGSRSFLGANVRPAMRGELLLRRLQALLPGISLGTSKLLYVLSVSHLLNEPLPLVSHFSQKGFKARVSRCASFLEASGGKSMIFSCVLHFPSPNERSLAGMLP